MTEPAAVATLPPTLQPTLEGRARACVQGWVLGLVVLGAVGCRREARGSGPLPTTAVSATAPSAVPSAATSATPEATALLQKAAALQAGAPLGPPRPGPTGALVQSFVKGCVGPDGSGRPGTEGLGLYTSCDPPKNLAGVLARLSVEVPKVSWGSDLAAGVAFLPTGTRVFHRPHEPRVAASIGKWFWAAAALHRTRVEDVEPAAVPAFAISDNAKGRVLIDLAGGADAVNHFTEKVLGIPAADLSLCRYQGDVVRKATACHRAAGIDNFFTPAGALAFLEAVWRGVPLGGAGREALLRWSRLAPDFGFSIGHQLPADVQAAMHHKRAELPTNCCDLPPEYNWTAEIAIVPTARGPYAVALSLAHSETYANQIGAIEWASCVLYHAVVEDVADPFAAGCKSPKSP